MVVVVDVVMTVCTGTPIAISNYVPLLRSVTRRPEVVVRVLAGGVATDAGGVAER